MDGSERSVRTQAVAKLRRLGLTVSPHGEVCAEFVSRLYDGLHHFPSDDIGLRKVAWHDPQHLSWVHYGQLATWDADGLTRAVLMAHDLGLRLTVQGAGPRYLRVSLGQWLVQPFGGPEPHPTMETALADWRTRNPARPGPGEGR